MIKRQLGPYAAIAGLCAALNISVMIAGDMAGVHYVISTAISFILCVSVGYSLHCRWTFRAAPRVEGLARYTLAMAVNYPASLIGIWGFYDLAGLPMTIAAPLSTAGTAGLNFALSRWAIASPTEAGK
jgi:putative flippase GtrA